MSKMKKKKAAPGKRAPEKSLQEVRPKLKRTPIIESEEWLAPAPDTMTEDDAPELPGIPEPLERKSWKLKTMADFAKLPRDQFPYAIYYAKFELNKGLMLGYAIDHFIWHEGGKLETFQIEASALD